MNKKIRKNSVCGLLLLALLTLCGCAKELLPAEVIIIDPARHYYPIVQGENLRVRYEIENISDNPLFIQEVQTTCGCLMARDELPIVILPHKRRFLNLDFNTIKNNGYVEHFIYCYGNFKDGNMVELQFDTNVVPPSDCFHDYEQLWKEQKKNAERHTRDDGSYEVKNYYSEDDKDSQPLPEDDDEEE